jgi:HD-like signal output (HDOD) protein
MRIILTMNKLEAYGHIAAMAIRGELVFPTSVNAALRVQLALDDPECPIDKAISLVLAEPQLAARTVAISNSAMFNRAGAPVITNVRGAIMRIGYQNLFALAAAMVVRQFGSKISDPSCAPRPKNCGTTPSPRWDADRAPRDRRERRHRAVRRHRA